MKVAGIEGDPELQRVLWACYSYWQREPLPPENRSICYSWVVGPFTARFGAGFHQSRLERLARLGFLEKDDTSRGGARRYYKLSDPARVVALLKAWGLN